MFEPNIYLANFGFVDTEGVCVFQFCLRWTDQAGVAEVIEAVFGKHPVRISAPLSLPLFQVLYGFSQCLIPYKISVWKTEKKLRGRPKT
jgi:hypothetical protein